MKGFKKDREGRESSKVEYCQIDASNYDTLGEVDSSAFEIAGSNSTGRTEYT